MTRRAPARTGVAAGLALALASCFHGSIDGTFRANGGPGHAWELTPDRCTSGEHSGYFGADLYRAREGDDTEIVVIKDGGGYRVLARAPNTGTMVVLTPADCTTFDAGVDYNGVSVNDIPGVAGFVRLDCTRPEIGHVTGTARFSCF
jgi:hypothetical protein